MNAFSRALLGASLALSSTAFSIDRTPVVAGKLGYPQEIVKLRNKADDFLRDARIGMTLDVRDLRHDNLELRADELTLLDNDAYFTLENDIDNVFEQISRQFVAGSNKLDDDDASIAEKAQFVNRMKVLAQQTIDGLLTEKANS